jgi:PAS domain S-box-containing protein
LGPKARVEPGGGRDAERQLRESEERYRRLFETAQDGILLLDAKTGQIIDANPFLVSMLGYSHREFLGRKLWEVGPFRDVIASKKYFKELQEKGYVRYEDLPLQKKRGGLVDVEFVSNSYPVGRRKVIQCNIRNITERKRNEADILREKERMGQYLDLVGAIVVALDGKGNVLLINKKGCEVLGYPEREIIGKNWFRNFIPGRTRREVRATFAKVKSGRIKGVENFENPVLSRGGKERLVSWHNINVMQNGRFAYSLSSGEDVTERREAELRLQESEARFRKVFEHSPIGMLLANPDFRFARANPAACRILRYSESELRKMTFRTITHPDNLANDIAQVNRLGRGEIPLYRTEKRYIRKGGALVWASVNVSTIHDDQGKLKYYLALIEDITEKKIMEDRLLESRARLRQVLEFLPGPNFALGLDGKITLWNRAMTELTGLSAKRMLGKDSRLVGRHFYGRDRSVLAELALRPGMKTAGLYDSLEKKGDLLVATNFIPHFNRGKPGYTWVMAKRIRDAQGRLIGAIESIRDVTEQKRNEAELISQKEKVEELSRARDRFIADMTHELKTPLSVILLHLDMVLRNGMGRMDESTLQSYDLMWRNAQRLSRSIEQIMQLTNLEAVSMHREKVALRSLIEAVIDEYLPLVRSKGLVLDAAGPELSLRCDPHLLAMVVSNFMSNAVKFTERGKIRVRWAKENGSVAITVSDTGVGVKPENREKIFNKFFKENPDAPGSGIGLALSGEIARKMGGRIQYHAEAGKGSAFRLILPKR